ncbi:hypothetical protein GCM10022419_010020 [Nonomuraea rosea]|uniref:Transposase IS4-like domain-containing protein n=1 Tax=Nonomuraea rosea TaxID=638574 RepID=A0ABP6VF41_9ACTN
MRNRAWLGSPSHGGYPQLELMTLVETGTRALIGAVFGPTSEGESGYARRLLHLLTPDMLVLRDKSFDGNAFLAQVSATGAQVLGRLRSNRRTPILATLTDCSYVSMIGSLQIRIIEARVTVTCTDGTTFAGTYRLATTLTNARRYPAAALVDLYHQRWEHESAYYALRHTIMQGRILHSGDPAGLQQEMWSVLTLYQLLRTVMVDAAESQPGTDPDRCGFSIALHAARNLVIRPGDNPGTATGLVGSIGRRVLAGLLPPRRPRVSTRKVKSPISRYHERLDDGRPDRSRAITDLDITLLTLPPHYLPPPATKGPSPRPTAADNNRSWPSTTKTPTALGGPVTSPVTSAMSL